MSTVISPSRISFGPRSGLTERHKVTIIWGALFLNVLSPHPAAIGKLAAQASLVLALALAVQLNPRIQIRPNVFLALLSVVAVVAVVTGLYNEFWEGSTYRAVRFILFLLVLWLLTPYWGRPDPVLLDAHLTSMKVIVTSVLVGFALFPGAAMATGRLSGILWPVPATQLAHYAAVILGVLTLQRLMLVPQTRWVIVWVLAAVGALIGTHTRTAILALGLGLAVAVGSLFLGYARVRRLSTISLTAIVAISIVLGPLLGAWLTRGQSASEISTITGRTLVWERVVAEPRGLAERIFGSGVSNASFDGLPIDSSWLATYYDLGLLGITVQVVVLLVLLLTAAVRPRGYPRAVALFLITYLIVASITETALNAPSPYLLDLTVAAALLALPLRGQPASTTTPSSNDPHRGEAP